VVAEKYRIIIFGRYPYEDQWRPLLATGLMLAMLIGSCTRAFWKSWLLPAWVVSCWRFLCL
jgi:general L-amino acid transport system permease protein